MPASHCHSVLFFLEISGHQRPEGFRSGTCKRELSHDVALQGAALLSRTGFHARLAGAHGQAERLGRGGCEAFP
eukprot:9386732-Pyramimonas_sp.AAC.1